MRDICRPFVKLQITNYKLQNYIHFKCIIKLHIQTILLLRTILRVPIALCSHLCLLRVHLDNTSLRHCMTQRQPCMPWANTLVWSPSIRSLTVFAIKIWFSPGSLSPIYSVIVRANLNERNSFTINCIKK